jgi:hypothetical protein
MLRNGRDFLITFTQFRATATCSISIVLEEHIAFDKIVSMHVWESECVLQMLKSILKMSIRVSFYNNIQLVFSDLTF